MERLDEVIARVLPGLRAMVVKGEDGVGAEPAPALSKRKNRRRRRARKLKVAAEPAKVSR